MHIFYLIQMKFFIYKLMDFISFPQNQAQKVSEYFSLTPFFFYNSRKFKIAGLASITVKWAHMWFFSAVTTFEMMKKKIEIFIKTDVHVIIRLFTSFIIHKILYIINQFLTINLLLCTHLPYITQIFSLLTK